MEGAGMENGMGNGMENSGLGNDSHGYHSVWELNLVGNAVQDMNLPPAAVDHTRGSTGVFALLALVSGIVACAASILLGVLSARDIFSLSADIAVIVVVVIALLCGIAGAISVVKSGFAGTGLVIAGNAFTVLGTCAVIIINVMFFGNFTGEIDDTPNISLSADKQSDEQSSDHHRKGESSSESRGSSDSDQNSSSIEDEGWASSSGVYVGGSYIDRPSSDIPQLPISSVSITGPDGSSRPNVQKWFDDLASGNFERMRSYCWTITPEVREARWFDEHIRGAILEAGTRRGEWAANNAQWVGDYVTVVFSPEEYASNYPCPIIRVDGKTDALTSADASYLLTRIVGQIDDNPIARDDDGRYETVCGTSSLSSIRAALGGGKEQVVRSFERAGSLVVKPERHSSDSVHYTVSSSGLSGSIELKQNIDNGNFCVNNVTP